MFVQRLEVASPQEGRRKCTRNQESLLFEARMFTTIHSAKRVWSTLMKLLQNKWKMWLSKRAMYCLTSQVILSLDAVPFPKKSCPLESTNMFLSFDRTEHVLT